MMSSPMGGRLSETVLRFLDAMADPLEARVMDQSLVRELYFHVLNGDRGPLMRAADAVFEVDTPASGAVTHASQWHVRSSRQQRGRLRKPVAIQQRIQAPVRQKSN